MNHFKTLWLIIWLAIAGVSLCYATFDQQTPPARNATHAVSTSASPTATNIEAIRVGDRVMGNLSDAELAGETQVDAKTWKKLRLYSEIVWDDGQLDDIHIETLQPPAWLEEQQAVLGAMVPLPLDLQEMGLPNRLQAEVVEVERCPAIADGPGRVVLTTVNHLNRSVYELTVESSGTSEKLRPTAAHKFYRVNDDAWVSAMDLRAGDTLRGVDGLLTVRDVQRYAGVHRVYNMTVEGEHVYRVAHSGVLVHNNGCVHANSRSSSLPNEGYGVINKNTGETYKFGVTARGVDHRFKQQAGKIAKDNGVSVSDLEAVKLSDFSDRASALKWEGETVGFFRQLGQELPSNIRPKGNPF